jgi:hypothetical protein
VVDLFSPLVQTIESLEDMLREAINLEVQMIANQEVLHSIHQRVSREDIVVCLFFLFLPCRSIDAKLQKDVKDEWTREVKKRLDAHEGKTSRQKYGKDASFLAFKQRIFVRIKSMFHV